MSTIPDLGSSSRRVEELNFAKLTVIQTATVVRKLYNTPKRKVVFQKFSANVVNARNIRFFMAEEEFVEAREIFDAIDSDHSESIDFAEIKRGFKEMEAGMDDGDLATLALELDRHDGAVMNVDEFAAFLFRVKVRLCQLAARPRLKRHHNSQYFEQFAEQSHFGRKIYDFVDAVDLFRDRLWSLLDEPASSLAAKCVAGLILTLIATSSLLFILESTALFQASIGLIDALENFDTIAVYIFTLEFAGRIFSCPSLKAFWLSGLNWIDLLAILPYFIVLISPSRVDGLNSSSLRVMRLVRILRVLKISRYLKWIGVFSQSLEASIFPLSMMLFVILIGMILFSSGIYFAERGFFDEALRKFFVPQQNQPDAMTVSDFNSIPGSFWFTLSTITSAGFGDVHPYQPTGQFIAVLAAVFGILILAVPISVISSNFRYEYDKLKTRQEIAQEQVLKSLQSAEAVEAELRVNRHLAKVISKCRRFALALASDKRMHDSQVFALSTYKTCLSNPKLAFRELKHLERDNRHLLIESLFALQQEYLSRQDIDDEPISPVKFTLSTATSEDDASQPYDSNQECKFWAVTSIESCEKHFDSRSAPLQRIDSEETIDSVGLIEPLERTATDQGLVQELSGAHHPKPK